MMKDNINQDTEIKRMRELLLTEIVEPDLNEVTIGRPSDVKSDNHEKMFIPQKWIKQLGNR